MAESFDDRLPVALDILTQIEVAGLQQAFPCSVGEEEELLRNRRAHFCQPVAQRVREQIQTIIDHA